MLTSTSETMSDHANQMLWYVVHTKPRHELLAATMLEERQNLIVFLPEVLQKYRGKMQMRPFFPGYLFVEADLNVVEYTAINSTPGVNRLVAFDHRPLPLKAEIIDGIREEIARINDEGGLPPDTYREGESVRLVQGPLAGLQAVFLGHLPAKDRVLVLLNFLGQENEVELDLSEIERASKVRRKRGTRGKGRKIHY
jgi:transcriptional antiterminator RfaH